MIVTDPAKKQAVAGYYAQSFERYIAPKRQALRPDDAAGNRMIQSASYLAERMADMPVLVIPCSLDQLGADASSEQRASLYGGVFPAIWSFQLALRSRGLGSTFTTLHLLFEEQARELLGIPEDVMQVALLPVAWTRGGDFRPAERPPAESIVHWNRWSGAA